MKKTKKPIISLFLIILIITQFSFSTLRPIIGWGDWNCSENEIGGLCWKNCHRTYYFFFAVDTEYWSGPCWQSPASSAGLPSTINY